MAGKQQDPPNPFEAMAEGFFGDMAEYVKKRMDDHLSGGGGDGGDGGSAPPPKGADAAGGQDGGATGEPKRKHWFFGESA